MNTDNYQKKHQRGSSPHQEHVQEPDHSVKNIRSIEQIPEDSQATQAVEQPGEAKTELRVQEPDAAPQSPDSATAK